MGELCRRIFCFFEIDTAEREGMGLLQKRLARTFRSSLMPMVGTLTHAGLSDSSSLPADHVGSGFTAKLGHVIEDDSGFRRSGAYVRRSPYKYRR